MIVCTGSACLCRSASAYAHDSRCTIQRQLRRLVEWRLYQVNRVRGRYQSVSRKRQADMAEMWMTRGATANVTHRQLRTRM